MPRDHDSYVLASPEDFYFRDDEPEEDDMPEIDTANKFMVGVQGDTVRVAMPLHRPLSRADALNLAAWLVALADPTADEFWAVLQAVQNT